MSFWNTATDEQKLAQIDNAIELGLTARQVGMNLGASKTQVGSFARYHGRRLPEPTLADRSRYARRQLRILRFEAVRAYYTHGDLNLWAM